MPNRHRAQLMPSSFATAPCIVGWLRMNAPAESQHVRLETYPDETAAAVARQGGDASAGLHFVS